VKTNEYLTTYLTVKYKQSILFARKSVSFISATYLLHSKKMNVHIIDSNGESDEEVSNTPPDIAEANNDMK
jgi:hypothetical protein